jgi:hypothetical protein
MSWVCDTNGRQVPRGLPLIYFISSLSRESSLLYISAEFLSIRLASDANLHSPTSPKEARSN